jgi:hypothetical protein
MTPLLLELWRDYASSDPLSRGLIGYTPFARTSIEHYRLPPGILLEKVDPPTLKLRRAPPETRDTTASARAVPQDAME